MEMELKQLGYTVFKSVLSGEKAMEKLKTEKPDVVIMDLNLIGKMNGIEAAREIYNIYKIPIIFMTGYQDESLKKEAMKLNPVAYLIKPFEIHEIEAAIDLII